jgi:hypothetical protein
MPFENEGGKENMYLKMPKEGEEYDFSVHGDIQTIEKVHNPEHKLSKFNFVKKIKMTSPDGKPITADEDQGYFYRITFVDGKKLTLSSWSPFLAMKASGITEGVSFMVKHPKKGEWIVELI